MLTPMQEKQSTLVRELAGYITLFRSRDNFKRVSTAWLVMFWQQWTGIDSSRSPPSQPLLNKDALSDNTAVIYYASSVFQSYGFSEGTTAELATGVTGSVFMASTIPAMVRTTYLSHGAQCTTLYRTLTNCNSSSSTASDGRRCC